MRGKRIFEDLTPEPPPPVPNLFGIEVDELAIRKGRSEAMIVDRNELLVARLYFYRNFMKHISPEVTMEQLVREFKITGETIPKVLSDLTTEMKLLMKMKPDAEWFARRYWWMVWDRNLLEEGISKVSNG